MKEIQKLIELERKQERINTLYWILGSFDKEITEEGKRLIRYNAEATQQIVDNSLGKILVCKSPDKKL